MDNTSDLIVDSWVAFIPNHSCLNLDIKTELENEVKKRGIRDLRIRKAIKNPKSGRNEELFIHGNPNKYLLFDIVTNDCVSAMLAFTCYDDREDLYLSWELYQPSSSDQLGSQMGQTGLIILGFGIFGAGLITSIFGFGLIAIPIGIYIMGIGFRWWGVNKIIESINPAEIPSDTKKLAHQVNFSLIDALNNVGISQGTLIITQRSNLLNN